MRDLPPVAVNLRRLFAWHLLTNKEVAMRLSSTEKTVSDWLNGKREPGGNYLRLIGALFQVNPVRLFDNPDDFGVMISDPARVKAAESQRGGLASPPVDLKLLPGGEWE